MDGDPGVRPARHRGLPGGTGRFGDQGVLVAGARRRSRRANGDSAPPRPLRPRPVQSGLPRVSANQVAGGAQGSGGDRSVRPARLLRRRRGNAAAYRPRRSPQPTEAGRGDSRHDLHFLWRRIQHDPDLPRADRGRAYPDRGRGPRVEPPLAGGALRRAGAGSAAGGRRRPGRRRTRRASGAASGMCRPGAPGRDRLRTRAAPADGAAGLGAPRQRRDRRGRLRFRIQLRRAAVAGDARQRPRSDRTARLDEQNPDPDRQRRLGSRSAAARSVRASRASGADRAARADPARARALHGVGCLRPPSARVAAALPRAAERSRGGAGARAARMPDTGSRNRSAPAARAARRIRQDGDPRRGGTARHAAVQHR